MRPIVYNSDKADPPRSLLDGVDAAICETLSISSLSHRSALLQLCRSGKIPSGAVAAAYAQISANWQACRGLLPMSASRQNWRWREPQLGIAERNTSPEVLLERAIVAACERHGRKDWSNQVPVASGVAGVHTDQPQAFTALADQVQLAGNGEWIEV